MDSSGKDMAFSAIGLIGGFLLAISALPQAFLMTGLAIFLLYYAYYSLWPVLLATSMSLTFLTYITGLKIYLENFAPKKTTPSADGVIMQDFTPGTALLPADQLAVQDARVQEGSIIDTDRTDSA